MTPIRKENSAALTARRPRASATTTVVPLREIPGRIANACAQPISSAATQPGSSPCARGSVNRVVHSSTPVTRRHAPTTTGDSNCASTASLPNSPTSTAGSVAMPSFAP